MCSKPDRQPEFGGSSVASQVCISTISPAPLEAEHGAICVHHRRACGAASSARPPEAAEFMKQAEGSCLAKGAVGAGAGPSHPCPASPPTAARAQHGLPAAQELQVRSTELMQPAHHADGDPAHRREATSSEPSRGPTDPSRVVTLPHGLPQLPGSQLQPFSSSWQFQRKQCFISFDLDNSPQGREG